MSGEKDLTALLKTLKPKLQPGSYVFCTAEDTVLKAILHKVVCFFREKEAVTVILLKTDADQLNLSYSFVTAWITLTVHSSLQAVGLTAAFSQALSKHGISCNVVAAYYHDHVFVALQDADKAMQVLQQLSEN